VADFCCPDYIVLMVTRIRSVWNQNQGATGITVVKFTIQRNGQITGAEVERTSGSSSLDLAALRAVVVTKTLPPLPDQFPNPTLGVRLNFDYQ
jgi:TonB family protein